MKALIRNPGETVTEADGIPGINWNNGMPLTNPVWAGGPYTMVNDYVPEDPAYDFDMTPARRKAKGAVQAPPAQAPAATVITVNPDGPVPVGDTIVIDGVTYTRAP